MSCIITGLGTAWPPFSIPQSEAARLATAWCCSTEDEVRRLHVLYRKSGVNQRRSVLLNSDAVESLSQQTFFPERTVAPQGPGTAVRMLRYEAEALPLGQAACTRALDAASLPAHQITHLITVSCTGFMAPGLDVALMETLRLRNSTERMHLGFMGCHGALIGLRSARQIVQADPSASVLLCCVELCTLHQQYGWRTDQVVANALFGDGAAAVVLQGTSATPDAWTIAGAGSILIPGTSDHMGWRVRDHGFEMSLSAGVPEVIERHAANWLGEWLSGHDLTLGQIQSWAVHPGGPKILESTAKAVGIPTSSTSAVRIDGPTLDDSAATLAEYGNMSSPTVLFILDRLRRREAPRPCVALAFGPGLTMEATLFR